MYLQPPSISKIPIFVPKIKEQPFPENLLDLNKYGEVTQDEIDKATKVLEKARKKEQRREHLKNLNSFMLRV